MQVVIPVIFPFSSRVLSLQKLDRTWKMMVDYNKFNKIVALITAALPDMLLLLKQINIASGTSYAAIDLVTSSFLSLSQRRFRNSSHLSHIECRTVCIYYFAPELF